jgi:thiol-disulfide isomerase/thioredoxin
MKSCKILLLSFFLLSSQIAFAQAVNSSITIKVNGGNYIISGIVTSDNVKNEVIEIVKTKLGSNTNFSKLSVSPDAKSFQIGWQTEFDKSLLKIKTWKSGIFVFSINKNQNTFPPISAAIGDSNIKFADGKIATIKDFNNKTVVLFLFATWCGPCLKQAQYLRDIYPRIASPEIEIIALNTDEEEKADVRDFFNRWKLPFNYGWVDNSSTGEFVKISKLNGIPQVFVISKGKLMGVFAGGGIRTNEMLAETLLKISE